MIYTGAEPGRDSESRGSKTPRGRATPMYLEKRITEKTKQQIASEEQLSDCQESGSRRAEIGETERRKPNVRPTPPDA